MKRANTNLALIVATLCCAATARAQPNDTQAQAKLHFDLGQKQVAAGRCKEAIAEFDAGYQLSHRPLFLFNMAECARSTGDLGGARELYARYLREEPEGQLSAKAKERLAALGPPPSGATTVPPPAVVAPPVAPPPVVNLAPTPPPATLALTTASSTEVPPKRPVWKRWPLWVGVGAAVAVSAAAISLGVVYGTRGTEHCGAGCSPVRFH